MDKKILNSILQIQKTVANIWKKNFPNNVSVIHFKLDFYWNSYLWVDSCWRQLIFTDHDQNAKHTHNEGIITDPFSLLKQSFPPA